MNVQARRIQQILMARLEDTQAQKGRCMVLGLRQTVTCLAKRNDCEGKRLCEISIKWNLSY